MKQLWFTFPLAILLAVGADRARAGSKVYLARQYPPGQLVSLDRIDHAPWDRLLKKYVDVDGLVDYGAWSHSRADMVLLEQYLDALARGAPQAAASRTAKLAFWINAYNAVTIRGILREYPTSSIRNHTAKLFGYNIWQDLLLWVGGEAYSLETIENKILRPSGEKRIHFAIVCASIGCPRLRNEAYTAERLDAQLADNTRDFFTRAAHFRADVSRRTVWVSPILQWFAEDFGPNPVQGLASLADYLPEGPVRGLVQSGQFTVEYLGYDWGLNDQRHVAQR